MGSPTMNQRGGTRPNAGRKPGFGKYGVPTVPVRVPAHLVEAVEAYWEEVMRQTRYILLGDLIQQVREKEEANG